MEAHERKKQRDKKRYANDPESKKSYEKARRLENRMPEKRMTERSSVTRNATQTTTRKQIAGGNLVRFVFTFNQ